MHVRVAQRPRARSLSAALFACCLWLACDRQANPGADVSLAWNIEPAPPSAGPETVVRITVRDRNQRPIPAARLRLEGHMSHAGMAPVVTSVTDKGDGVYEARLRFTMAGDWVLVVDGELRDGSRITRQLEVTGVRPAS
jgi:hypothetical protein